MPIDTTIVDSPGWHLARLTRKLTDPRRVQRLKLLNAYIEGQAPLPEGAENVREIYVSFQRKARSNFAELIIGAVLDRMRVVGFRTAKEHDDNGDEDAAKIARENGLNIELADAIENMLTVGDGYMMVGLDDNRRPVITSEDPRQVITEHDPLRPQTVRSALKLFHDETTDRDHAFLFLTADSGTRVYVASRDRRATTAAVTFNASAYDWDASFGGEAGKTLPAMPIVRFQNKRGVGEFEPHLDLLDRINHMILERMTIAVMQAFRQRAVKGNLPTHDLNGVEIDYDKAFEAGPAALWQLPEGVDIWESAYTDLTPILASVKADIEHLAAITRTPMYALFPESTNQSAEGASLAREGLVFKTEDRMARCEPPIAKVMALAFLFLGDKERADALTIEPIWASVERYSLSERGSAWSQMTDMPFETKLREVMQFSPEQIARAKTERMDDAVLAPQLAALAGPPPAPAGPAAPAAAPAVSPISGVAPPKQTPGDNNGAPPPPGAKSKQVAVARA